MVVKPNPECLLVWQDLRSHTLPIEAGAIFMSKNESNLLEIVNIYFFFNFPTDGSFKSYSKILKTSGSKNTGKDDNLNLLSEVAEWVCYISHVPWLKCLSITLCPQLIEFMYGSRVDNLNFSWIMFSVS